MFVHAWPQVELPYQIWPISWDRRYARTDCTSVRSKRPRNRNLRSLGGLGRLASSTPPVSEPRSDYLPRIRLSLAYCRGLERPTCCSVWVGRKTRSILKRRHHGTSYDFFKCADGRWNPGAGTSPCRSSGELSLRCSVLPATGFNKERSCCESL